MRAMVYNRFGPASDVLALNTLEPTQPAEGEVRVKLAYSGVNPSDVKARAGARPGVVKPAFDLITPHSDGAGIITDLGAGVSKKRLGERVWIWNGQWARAHGTAADYITLPATQAVALPEGISLQTGAVLGIPGLTAAHCVLGGGAISGKTLLISGAGGTVGHLAVQLAKAGGAQVIATASPPHFERVLAAGADHVFDYKAPDLGQDIRELCSAGVDRAVELEFGLNAPLLADVMRPEGVISVYGSALDMNPSLPFGQFLFKALKIDIALIYILNETDRQNAIDSLHKALTAGDLLPQIDQIYPLEECASAHQHVERGGRYGAVLLEIK